MRSTRKFNLTGIFGAVVFILPLLASLQGCNTTGCIDNRSSIPLAEFYSYQTGTAISIDSISVGGVGAPGDSLLLAPGTAAKSVYLPFSSETDKVRFFISYDWKNAPLPDTITFEYETIPYFVSEECGAMYRYRITHFGHTTTLIDSIAVTDSLITNVERANIKLFFRTETSGEE